MRQSLHAAAFSNYLGTIPFWGSSGEHKKKGKRNCLFQYINVGINHNTSILCIDIYGLNNLLHIHWMMIERASEQEEMASMAISMHKRIAMAWNAWRWMSNLRIALFFPKKLNFKTTESHIKPRMLCISLFLLFHHHYKWYNIYRVNRQHPIKNKTHLEKAKKMHTNIRIHKFVSHRCSFSKQPSFCLFNSIQSGWTHGFFFFG